MTQETPPRTARRPGAADFAPYYSQYVDLVPGGEIAPLLEEQGARLDAMLGSIPGERAGHAYGPDKWTIAEVVGHIVDIERVFSYRILCFCRGMGDVDLAGIDQDVMVPASGANARGLASLAEEFRHLRASNVTLLRSLSDADLDSRGRASGVEFTALAAAFVMYGHAEHHGRVLAERYL